MNLKTLASLLKLREYQLEVEQWKLALKQKEELNIKEDIDRMAGVIRDFYNQEDFPEKPQVAARLHQFFRDANVLHEMGLRKLEQAKRVTNEQLLVTLEAQKKKEMMSRLHQRGVEQEHLEFDLKERKFLDDLAQARYLQQEG
jgi:hypothetical protein